MVRFAGPWLVLEGFGIARFLPVVGLTCFGSLAMLDLTCFGDLGMLAEALSLVEERLWVRSEMLTGFIIYVASPYFLV